MTTTLMPPHPCSVAAGLRAAEAHESAAAVLRRRNPAASQAHAEAARDLRAKASGTWG